MPFFLKLLWFTFDSIAYKDQTNLSWMWSVYHDIKIIIIILELYCDYLEHLPGGTERQYGHADHEVGHGQRNDERVGRRPELGAVKHGGHDESVADGHD